ncbi:TerC family protein [Lysobacter sp. TY2-98]|uniref:TerC family protein n=1 Tax=Lysobacter sp. TY2-98 TaxID=2290922 RepID=UPI000E1FCA14|nr:TerC family protein [Lysobacter sp. TY2-98]AXK73266.1 TerC family protein [Lysobacter sp. TY2-98]
METIASPLMWTAFGGLVVLALLADLVLMRHGGAHRVTFKEALGWSVGWVAVALAFGGWLWWIAAQRYGDAEGQRIALEYLTGYLIEKSLAVDNIFVFLMLFTYFAVPEQQRQKVLVLGVLGAILLRGVMIFAGAVLLAKFHWILYVFGAFLLLTGVKMWAAAGKEPDLEANPVLRWMRGHLNLTEGYRGDAFVVRESGLRRYTPLFVVMVLIAVTDVIFAVDSIPAIFAITKDPFVVLTSNVFAVLGLRAMFFLLAGLADRFHLLPYGLAVVLVFIGAKMLAIDVIHLPVMVSLGAVVAIIGATVALSLLRPQRSTPAA